MMSWIRQGNPTDEPGGLLDQVYSAAKTRAGDVAEILKVMSLRPDLLQSFMQFYVQLMKGPGALTTAEREWIAVLTSEANNCHY
ncbi:MAG: hypothetical protein CBC13_09035 [Planctomycetia bacterium TMED53]|nr:MAG: hypothetical protein CBC13_09035 [Planctomycetia bacterium TMED53]